MKIGIIGLGLIGGSMAKAIKAKTDHQVFGYDASKQVCASAKLLDAVDGFLENGNPEGCDMVFVALYPKATIAYLQEFGKYFKKGALVFDLAGIKSEICKAAKEIAEEYGFVFCGAHPMAGTERSGFTYSRANMFEGASMVLTPYQGTDIGIMNDLSLFLKGLGFARMQVATPEEHDKMISYTSQLAHVVSSAYIKSELSSKYKGFSGGSFNDMTRVAKLNENMWTELFLENSEFLADETDDLIARLQGYSKAIRNHDAETLRALLKEGKELRIAVDDVKDFD